MKHLLKWLKSHEGATAVEYAIIVGGIACAIIVVIFLTGDDLESLWDSLGSALSSSVGKL